jgi:hypothetical protein
MMGKPRVMGTWAPVTFMFFHETHDIHDVIRQSIKDVTDTEKESEN